MGAFNIQEDIEINRYNLKSECISMASIYFRYADAAKDAKTIISDKRDNLKAVTAERNIAIRESLANSKAKVTEGIINSMVDSDPIVLQARKELREAEATYEGISVMVSALEIKKSELDNLVKLECNSMYVENPSKPTRDIQAEGTSEYLRKNMQPVPNSNIK